jgi:hypothetical protein
MLAHRQTSIVKLSRSAKLAIGIARLGRGFLLSLPAPLPRAPQSGIPKAI